MDVARLRELLCRVIINPDLTTGSRMDDFCRRHGVSLPTTGSSKRERLESAMAETPDSALGEVAARCLASDSVRMTAAIRTQLQDILWQDSAVPTLSKKIRREVARAMDAVPRYGSRDGYDRLLRALWPVEPNYLAALFGGHDDSLYKQIEQHVHRNDDWSNEYLFQQLGALESPDPRFCLFLQELASGDVRPDVAAQREFVAAVNQVLVQCGAELREIDERDGYPAFRVVSTYQGVVGRPKNIIFASSVKPDIRFRDAVNNDIEIATNADKVLVYDRPLGSAGLTWNDLQSWWAETNSITDPEQAKKSLYGRLRGSIPTTSPPQLILFRGYYETLGSAIPQLPALLPEVWLHWDHKTVKERGVAALLRFRMDFLMLLPAGVRIVIEVDGQQHYAKNGQADPARYAAMMEGDRQLKLAGYEVFRFGAHELTDEALESVGEFFRHVLKRYGVAA